MKLNRLLQEIIDENLLLEKQIEYNNNARYGQIVVVAGGAGSGKGFAIDNFMNAKLFKIINVDEYKNLLQKIDQEKRRYPEIRGLDTKNPEDTYKLHRFVKKLDIKNNYLEGILQGAVEGRLPNLMFDETLKDLDNLDKVLPQLKDIGYKKENMHITWVLTNYHIAVNRNETRDRVVPEDVVFETHQGAAKTMINVLKGNMPRGMNGAVRIILNNPEHTVSYDRTTNVNQRSTDDIYGTRDPQGAYKDDNENPLYTGQSAVQREKEEVIRDFKYVTVKEAGKPFKSELEINQDLYYWIKNNIPKTSSLFRLMSE